MSLPALSSAFMPSSNASRFALFSERIACGVPAEQGLKPHDPCATATVPRRRAVLPKTRHDGTVFPSVPTPAQTTVGGVVDFALPGHNFPVTPDGFPTLRLLDAPKLTIPQAARRLGVGETKKRRIVRNGIAPLR